MQGQNENNRSAPENFTNVSVSRIEPPFLTNLPGPGSMIRQSTVVSKLYAIFNP